MVDLTTLDSAKTYIGVATAVDDAPLMGLITAYSEFVRSYCNRTFSLATFTEYFDGRNNSRQMLPEFPIASIVSLSVDGIALQPQAAFGQPGFRFDDNCIILDGYAFTRGESNILVTWTAGYAVIPADIAQAVNELVGLRYALRDKQGWSSKMLAGETVSLITKDMPSSVATVLNQYRAVVPL
jgi:hypothetical protein